MQRIKFLNATAELQGNKDAAKRGFEMRRIE